MSRPNISYPTPVPGPSTFSTSPPPRPPYDPELRRQANQPQPRSTSASSSRTHTGSLDSHITRLLVTTKQLLQGLEAWSQGQITETQVSDVYVKLGNGFEICVTAFHKAGIQTKELDSIPDDLRACLETALAEDPSPDTLNVYLPDIRLIIYNLLNGLKQKQAAYKRLVSQSTDSPPPPKIAVQQEDERLSARSGASSTSGGGSPAATPSQLPGTRAPSSSALADRAQQRGLPSRPAPPDAFRPARMRPPEGLPRRSVSPTPSDGLVRHQLSDKPVPSPPPLDTSFSAAPPPALAKPALPQPTPPHPDRFSRDSFGNPRVQSRFSADSEITNGGSPIRSPVSRSPPRTIESLREKEEDERPPLQSDPKPSAAAAPSLPTLNLPDTSLLPDPPIVTPPPELDVPPETRATLAALGRSDALERRASKRYSSYNFSKILPGPSSPNHKKSVSTGSPQRPIRRQQAPPPMPTLSESVASANLALSAATGSGGGAISDGELSDDGRKAGSLSPNGVMGGEADSDRQGSVSPSTSSYVSAGESESSMRVVKTPEPSDNLSPSALASQSTPRPSAPTSSSRPAHHTGASPPAPSVEREAGGPIRVFLQIGRQVKKARLEQPVTLSSLRLMFMERFEYDPGMEDFPDVYLRDPQTGVSYELEDMDDLREGVVLSLDIEPLDQVKQHFDLTFAQMMQELKELKTSLDHSRRISMTPSASLLSVSPSQTHRPMPQPTSLSPVAERSPSPSPVGSRLPALNTALPAVQQEQLQKHQNELTTLRRDLAVLRQIHVDFLTESKESFGKLRTQNASMREVVKTKMGGSRALLDNSKAKLEAQCAETIQAVEEISDTIDTAREDAFRRFVTPGKGHMANIRTELQKAREMVESFTREVSGVEPTWRATWHFELSRVMEEQKLLPYQSKLCQDLRNDIRDAEEMLRNVQDFVDQRQAQRAAGVGPLRGYRPPTPEEDGGGGGEAGIPHLLMEIRTKESDPNQRLRAIEAQRKAREREKALKEGDEFSEELKGFVSGRRLKKTGGTEEVERQRQRKNDVTIRKMLTGGGEAVGEGVMLSPQMTGGSSVGAGGGGGLTPQMTGSTVGGGGGRASRGGSLEPGQG